MTRQFQPVDVETTQPLDTMLHQILNQALVAIDAKAGSLMLVAEKQKILQIKARLGPPRSGRVAERVLSYLFSLSGSGFEWCCGGSGFGGRLWRSRLGVSC